MCGRYTLTTNPERMRSLGIEAGFADLRLTPRFNIAPTQEVPIVLAGPGGRTLAFARWGLVPSWVKEPRKGPPLINARADTVAEKPSFRGAFTKRRCLIPADGFFEWLTSDGAKRPRYFQMADHSLFVFAGLWERRRGEEGEVLSCTIITTEANDLVRPTHERMPVILPPGAYSAWLDPANHDKSALISMLAPYPAALMSARPVSERVNASRNDDPGVLDSPEESGSAAKAE